MKEGVCEGGYFMFSVHLFLKNNVRMNDRKLLFSQIKNGQMSAMCKSVLLIYMCILVLLMASHVMRVELDFLSFASGQVPSPEPSKLACICQLLLRNKVSLNSETERNDESFLFTQL